MSLLIACSGKILNSGIHACMFATSTSCLPQAWKQIQTTGSVGCFHFSLKQGLSSFIAKRLSFTVPSIGH